ncbi:MAG: 4Fe-4S dicluster domain-containing protein [Acidobacteria bacterium]|nr:MAG: 4Fe-4S dicluster domain-containing protein [Acidobacteriota bacterium]
MAKWGMVIDLDRCTGCEACVIACHAENNLPIVGEEESAKGRQHNWIRIERYWEGEYPHIRARFIPVLCQQCDHAPCEPVCPVYATYHNPEGLNAQVYNRCIGTRFCANNCPYTVRVFNWFDHQWERPLDEQLNPDVSIRTRGMMEKCTFCVQRIRRARHQAEDEGRDIRDGEVQPACVQSCPTEAMVFGDLDDPDSRASQRARSRRAFRLLEELGTEPSVIYLKEDEWVEP